VRPADAAGRLPAVLVVHENRGLNPHIEDVARRIALDGYMALAPDALFPLGGYPGDEDKARELFPKLDQTKTREDFVAAANMLRARPDATGRLGAVGFCYGGGIVNMLATRVPELAAGVPFYGGPAPLEDVPQIKAALLLQFARRTTRASTRRGPATRQRSRRRTSATRRTSTRARSTDSTTTRRRATTRRRRSWRGSGRWTSSRSTCADRRLRLSRPPAPRPGRLPPGTRTGSRLRVPGSTGPARERPGGPFRRPRRGKRSVRRI
jgi:dienelactone hydrolase